MAYTERKDAPFRKRGGFHRKKKVCVFCGKDNAIPVPAQLIRER